MSVAFTIMHLPEATKERVEWTTLDVTATEIPHSTRSETNFHFGCHRLF